MSMMGDKDGEGTDLEGAEPAVSEPINAAANDSGELVADTPVDADELPLDPADGKLPWLEDDEEDDNDGGSDGGRVLGVVVLSLVALAAIVGGIWWGTHRTPDATLVADGSTIAAPGQPYKEAPKNPGGKTFDGTGNTAFAVSEGQTRPAKLGEGGSSPMVPPPGSTGAKPGFDSIKTPAGAPSAAPHTAASPTAAATPPAASGPAVQVGAYSSRASAEAAWSRLSQQYSALSGEHHQIVEGKADIGTVFRLQALPSDAAAAQALCGKLKSAGLACQVK